MLPARGCCILTLADISTLAAIGHLPQGPSPLPVEMAYTRTKYEQRWPHVSRFETRAHELRNGLRPAGARMRAPTGWQYIALRYTVNTQFGVFHNLPGAYF